VKNSLITVIKLDTNRQETWRYTGTVLHQNTEKITIEAFFNRSDTPLHGILLREGDRFLETFFFNRWYNIFAMYDRVEGNLKGWYCNITFPAELTGGEISYVDLALDLLVFPNGRQLELDYDEFNALDLPLNTQEQAVSALQDLKTIFGRAIPKI
jgi:predicted RNA-binding protein associated with RNAse of E/G family